MPPMAPHCMPLESARYQGSVYEVLFVAALLANGVVRLMT